MFSVSFWLFFCLVSVILWVILAIFCPFCCFCLFLFMFTVCGYFFSHFYLFVSLVPFLVVLGALLVVIYIFLVIFNFVCLFGFGLFSFIFIPFWTFCAYLGVFMSVLGCRCKICKKAHTRLFLNESILYFDLILLLFRTNVTVSLSDSDSKPQKWVFKWEDQENEQSMLQQMF